jgi:hypothetical protein
MTSDVICFYHFVDMKDNANFFFWLMTGWDRQSFSLKWRIRKVRRGQFSCEVCSKNCIGYSLIKIFINFGFLMPSGIVILFGLICIALIEFWVILPNPNQIQYMKIFQIYHKVVRVSGRLNWLISGIQ